MPKRFAQYQRRVLPVTSSPVLILPESDFIAPDFGIRRPAGYAPRSENYQQLGHRHAPAFIRDVLKGFNQRTLSIAQSVEQMVRFGDGIGDLSGCHACGFRQLFWVYDFRHDYRGAECDPLGGLLRLGPAQVTVNLHGECPPVNVAWPT